MSEDLRSECIFCDDIRVASGGKHILIGIYGGNIILPSLPASFQISLWVRIFGLPLGEHSFQAHVGGSDGKFGAVFEGSAIVQDDRDPAVFTFERFPLHVETAGHIAVTFSFDNEPAFEVGNLRIGNPVPQSNETSANH
ncbi:hypothetical protein RFM41_24565 [Mesorhizobium sp. VK25A]|uniref:Wzt C-terminal domain-containing protein n=1 Tax=Mesorhizobium vachelliae TaxID=3072309 RepID=A0ABU5A9B1_9HYPH|nr:MULTISPECIES: hypothetical protein [unclassified Mesorhizobium]MDX8534301.1 hypothetical protein [Mesorhizobium sp. VK25D]MDX8546943.1 hypothetical protein [Mesorhizobium sp. VK25A]